MGLVYYSLATQCLTFWKKTEHEPVSQMERHSSLSWQLCGNSQLVKAFEKWVSVLASISWIRGPGAASFFLPTGSA